MRFLVDECAGPAVADWLRSRGYDVFSIYDSARGLDDEAVIEKAMIENWILVTNDKDFGEKVYRERRPHHGVILMRLDDECSKSKIKVLKRLLESHAKRLPEQFVVVTEKKVRFAGQ
jgi:predicted nuclease of predicted toxin-antitoxin system